MTSTARVVRDRAAVCLPDALPDYSCVSCGSDDAFLTCIDDQCVNLCKRCASRIVREEGEATRRFLEEHAPLRAARGILNGLALSAVLWVLLVIGARELFGQEVEPRVTLRDGAATTLVSNTSAAPLAVTVALFYPDAGGILPDTTRAVDALVSPRRFALGPSEHQVVRIRLRGAVAGPLRLVSCFVPVLRLAGRVVLVSRGCLNAVAVAR